MIKINNIFIRNFKNFSLSSFKFDKFNIIYGENGIGKTTLLESIFMILNNHTFDKNIRTIQQDKSIKTIISGSVQSDNNYYNLYIEINNNKKTSKINSKLSKTIEFKEKFPVLLYSIKSFINFKNKQYIFSLLDRYIFMKDKTILNELLEYNKIIKLKRSILKKSPIDTTLINITNEKLVELMKSISDKRKKSVELINKKMVKIFERFSHKSLKVKYEKKKIEKTLFNKELYEKRIIVSLNRDIFHIYLDEKELFLYSSLGEKKILLFCMIYSIALQYNEIKKPILLIDDLEGDLDNHMKKIITGILEDMPNQIFLTTLEYYDNTQNMINLAKGN